MQERDEQTVVHALVNGQAYEKLPEDLFIPPDALEVLLESFSGPLDLLLYLIRKQNLDILNIPLLKITRQYIQYIEFMEARKISLAADYLVMAALLAEIKSRCLLPVTEKESGDAEEDPRMELVRRLQLYEAIKNVSTKMDALPRQEREHFVIHLQTEGIKPLTLHPEVSLDALIDALKGVLTREERLQHHEISAEPLSVRERMSQILEYMAGKGRILFTELFSPEEGRGGVVVSLLAILELARQSLIIITQIHAWSPVHVEGVEYA